MKHCLLLLLLCLSYVSSAQPGTNPKRASQSRMSTGALVTPPNYSRYVSEKDAAYRQYLKELVVDSIKQVIAATTDTPTKAAAYSTLADYFARQLMYDSSETYYLRAIEYDNDTGIVSANTHNSLAETYIQRGQFKMAKNSIIRTLALKKNRSTLAAADAILIWIYSNLHDYDQMKLLCRQVLGKKDSSPDPYLALGQVYLQEGHLDSAKIYLQKAIVLDSDKTWISAWGHNNLGEALVKTNEKELALKEFYKTIAISKTNNSVRRARHLIDSVSGRPSVHGDPSLQPNWLKIEGANITYYFQDTNRIGQSPEAYVDQHENAYTKLNQIFMAKLPVKMTFYVWNDHDLAQRALGRPLGFTHPDACVTHAHYSQTVGHEMTHTLAYWVWGFRPVSTNKFINEGVAVAFDLTKRNKDELARKALEGKAISSVIDIWKNEQTDEFILYPVGGAFIAYIYKVSTTDEFRQLIKNQSIESAIKIYGKDRFERLIADFDKLMGLK